MLMDYLTLSQALKAMRRSRGLRCNRSRAEFAASRLGLCSSLVSYMTLAVVALSSVCTTRRSLHKPAELPH